VSRAGKTTRDPQGDIYPWGCPSSAVINAENPDREFGVLRRALLHEFVPAAVRSFALYTQHAFLVTRRPGYYASLCLAHVLAWSLLYLDGAIARIGRALTRVSRCRRRSFSHDQGFRCGVMAQPGLRGRPHTLRSCRALLSLVGAGGGTPHRIRIG